MPREIGWSQESILIYQIKQALSRLSSIGGGGSGTSTITISSSSNTTTSIDSGKLVLCVTINNAAGLLAFTIGTTLGGEEISPAQSIPAGLTKVILVMIETDSPTTLYFGGITSISTIKIYTIP